MCRLRTAAGIRIALSLILPALFAAALPAVAKAQGYFYTWASVFPVGGNHYYWGYEVSAGGNSNWTSQATTAPPHNYPHDAGDGAYIVDPLSVDEFIDLAANLGVGPDFSLSQLILNAGPLGRSYTIEQYAGAGSLSFYGAGSFPCSITVGNDAGNDVIACPIDVLSPLTVTGNKLLISGPVYGFNPGAQLIVNNCLLTLSGPNGEGLYGLYNPLGTIVLQSGALFVSQATNLGDDSTIIDFQGGTLHPTASFSTMQPVTIESAGGAISLNPGTTLTLAGHVTSSAGSLQVLGGGTLELATANPYTGGLVVDSSVLLVSNSAALGGTSGTLVLNSSTLMTTASFSSHTHVTLSGSSLFVVADGTTLTAAGPIDGSGGLFSSGGGTLDIESPNSFTGGIYVRAGTLRVIDDTGLGDPANSIAIDSATLNVGRSFNTNRGVVVNQATIKVDNAATFVIFSPVTGAGLTKTGGGTLLLAHANSFTSQLAINAGDVSVSADNALGDAANSLSFNGGGLTVNPGFTTPRPVLLDAGGGTFSVSGPSSTLIASGQFTGFGMLTKTGPGTLVLANGGNSYNGGTDIIDGTLRIGADAMLGMAFQKLTFDSGGSPVLNTTADIAMPRPINLNNPSATFDVNAGTTLTLSGVISGSGMLTKTGPGTLVLANGGNSYNGGTDIIDGTLRIGADAMLGTASRTLTFDSGGSPVLNTTADIPMPRPINLNNPSATFDVNASTTLTLSGVIGGPGGLVKIGAGTLTLSGAGANNYSGNTTVNDGTLVISTGSSGMAEVIVGNLTIGDGVGATGSAVVTFAHSAQVNQSAPSTVTINSDGVLNLRKGGTIAPAILGPLVMSGGAINTSGAPGQVICDLTGNITTLASNTTATISGVTGFLSADSQTNTFMIAQGTTSNGVDLDVSADLGGTALVKAGPGTLRLSGANSYAGGTVLSQGGLDINSTNAIGSGLFSVSDGTTIDNTSSGAITLAANNRQTWGGSFTFVGTQSLNFGTGAVTLNANPTVTVSASTLTVGVIGDGTGNSLIKSGAGTLIVFGGALYTGTTAVNAGTLTINGAAFSSSASTVAAAATMNFVNGANAGNGTFANSGSADSTIAGGLIQFSDNGTTAGNGIYTNNGVSLVTQYSSFSGNGGQIVFNSGASAGNATIVNNGSTYEYGGATGGQTYFNGGSTAGNATITTQGGRDPMSGGPAAGGLTLFSGNATAGAATLITNAGSLGGNPGLTEFKDTASGGTANITINVRHGQQVH